jgi:hypothetical protein
MIFHGSRLRTSGKLKLVVENLKGQSAQYAKVAFCNWKQDAYTKKRIAYLASASAHIDQYVNGD